MDPANTKLRNKKLLINYFFQKTYLSLFYGSNNYLISINYKYYYKLLNLNLLKTLSFGFYYLQGFVFILFIDACLTDDEPLWEPIE